jgi:sacsin
MPPPASPREHVERIRRERYFIGRGEQNPLAEDMHQAVNYLSQELYSKDVHFLMELVQVSATPSISSCSCVANNLLVRSSVYILPK